MFIATGFCNISARYLRFTWPLLLLFFFCPIGIFASDSEIEAEIWSLEEAYISGFRDAAHDKVIPMWHEQFLGWPANRTRPADKQAVVAYLKRYAAVHGTWSFEIKKAGIHIHKDVAITHFILHRTVDSDAGMETRRSTRVTHTWIREGSQWKILGGMSANAR